MADSLNPAAPVRSSAPARIDLAGGWTDVAGFAERHSGLVVNAAIELRTVVTVACSRRTGQPRSPMSPLVRAAVNAAGMHRCDVAVVAAAPAGSGLGSSGALGVALVAALDRVAGVPRTPVETADEAWRVEAVEAGMAGGRQDQYAAALGGFNALTCKGSTVLPRPLALEADFLTALAYHSVLCFTGESRVSSHTIIRVMEAFEHGDVTVTAALHRLVEVAAMTIDALEHGDIGAVGRGLTANWLAQQRLDASMRTDTMARLESVVEPCGILGSKAVGAGAGGSMYFLVRDPDAARRLARAAGATVLPVQWAPIGIRFEDQAG